MDFKDFNFHAGIFAGVKAAGYEAPTPIQGLAIPPVMKGHDVIGLAQTGTGKTAAFVLPILERLVKGPRRRVRALIISPTRELAEQTHQAIGTLGKETGLRSVAIYGGVSINPQKTKLRQAEIVTACPGRLIDHIGQGSVSLSGVEVLVIDEADRMFDMGFFPDIRRILRHVPNARQTLLFSATMPAQIRKLANEVLRNPVAVQVGTSAPADTVSHALYPVSPHLKTALLLEILRHTDAGSVLVFTRTKHRAKRLGERLVKSGYSSTSLQGNLSQGRRQAALEGFRDGKFQILVATDIAARGIDVSGISHVINYDIPSTPDAYIHRIGRTGRAASTGDAFTLVTGEDADMVRAINRVLGSEIDRRILEGFDYDSPAPKKQDNRPPRRHATPGRKPAHGKPFSPKAAAFGRKRQAPRASAAQSRPR